MEKEIKDNIAFMIEFYKLKHKMTAKEVYNLFEKYGIFDYFKNFNDDISQLSSTDAVIENIDELLEKKGYKYLKTNDWTIFWTIERFFERLNDFCDIIIT